MFGGILKKFGTESYAISGTLVAFAFDCATRSGAPASTSDTTKAEHKRRFMQPPRRKGRACSARQLLGPSASRPGKSYVAVQPPSTTMSAPVTNDDAGDARNRHAGTNSCGSPQRPS